MKNILLLSAFLLFQVQGKIIIEKLVIKNDPNFTDVKYEIKDETSVSVEVNCLADADDIVLELSAYSKVDGVYNPFVKPEPIHICKLHEHEDPLVQFFHEELNKFGNITKACPLRKGAHFYIKDFKIDQDKFPMPLPSGEFRIEAKALAMEGEKVIHQGTYEIMFRTVKD